MEIERKFLIPDLKATQLDLSKYTCKQLTQDYLYVDKLTSVRKRKIVENNVTKYYYTVKTDRKGISVNEIEKEIDEVMYSQLALNPQYNRIIKSRYVIPYIENLKIELDVFSDIYSGIVFAEIEYKDEEQARSLQLPNWFGKELSGIVSNSAMATLSSETIFNILRK